MYMNLKLLSHFISHIMIENIHIMSHRNKSMLYQLFLEEN